MKQLIYSVLLAGVLIACGGESEPLPTPEPQAETENSGSVEVDPTPVGAEESESSNIAGSGSVSDAVIDTAVDSVESSQTSPDALLADGRVIVGDQGGDESISAQAVSLVTGVDIVSEFLNQHPSWRGVAFDQGEYYSIELRTEGTNERLGWATVDVVGEDVLAYFVSRELPPAEFAEGKAIIEGYVFNEPLVAEALGDLSAWDSETRYRYQEGVWEIRFTQGDKQIVIPVDNWEERYFIDSIYQIVTDATADPNEQIAIDVARTAFGIDDALASRNDWEIYVSDQDDDVYAVSFTAPGRELFYVRVNVITEEILVAIPGYR